MFLRLVDPEIEFLSVGLPTKVALMRLSAVDVQLEMLSQIPILCESLPTELASIGLFASVNSHVIEEVPSLFKDFITVLMLTPEVPPVSVSSLVFLEKDFELPVEPVEVL